MSLAMLSRIAFLRRHYAGSTLSTILRRTLVTSRVFMIVLANVHVLCSSLDSGV